MRRDAVILIMAVLALAGLQFYWHMRHNELVDTSPSGLHTWPVLMQTTIHADYTHNTYTADIPDAVKAMVGKQIVISGFMVPLEAEAEAARFILSRRAPSCPFCPPGAPNEVIDVQADAPIAWTDNMLTLEGTFELFNDTQAGLFFHLSQAHPVSK